ncbi:5-formyltetrahydrofolate cyclo-ligase [Streptococcus catagoni]|uniref:5-formyltetrahydrofolate cyclo-ligase n=1 Tax=Streptococcus catagoni TaxID=2654874 RepID=UPI00140D5D22|nr:5-formyltetrahydrofolate cyclo-ligase [Streptococcus catagoni]
MTKKEIRQRVLLQMRSLAKEDKAKKDKELLDLFCRSEKYQEAKTIATYLPMAHEYKSHLIINQAIKDGKKVLVPKTYPKGRMVFVAYDTKDLERTNYGLLEPKSELSVAKEEIDLIHVPGLAFNPDGFRIGYGGGFYDRYLSDYKGHTVSTIYKCQEQNFQAQEHDVAVKEVFSR